MGKAKKLSRILFNVLYALFIALCVVLLASAVLSKRGDSFFGLGSYIVLTGSMSPTFEAGSYIIVRETPAEDVRVGDVITFRVDADAVLTHRVVEIVKDGEAYAFRTQGDANNAPDTRLVTQERLIGAVLFWVNGLGIVLLALQQPRGLIAVLALLCLVLLAPEAWRVVKKKSAGRKQIDGDIESKKE